MSDYYMSKDRADLELERALESNRKTQKLLDDIQRSLDESKKGPPSQRKEIDKK